MKTEKISGFFIGTREISKMTIDFRKFPIIRMLLKVKEKIYKNGKLIKIK